jgi:hypothetical protein
MRGGETTMRRKAIAVKYCDMFWVSFPLGGFGS